jgi:hypothetical protein
LLRRLRAPRAGGNGRRGWTYPASSRPLLSPGSAAAVASIFPTIASIFPTIAAVLRAVASILPSIAHVFGSIPRTAVVSRVAAILTPIPHVLASIPHVLAPIAAVFPSVDPILDAVRRSALRRRGRVRGKGARGHQGRGQDIRCTNMHVRSPTAHGQAFTRPLPR